jgi:Spy/CpxP family protein refolding chaperone
MKTWMLSLVAAAAVGLVAAAQVGRDGGGWIHAGHGSLAKLVHGGCEGVDVAAHLDAAAVALELDASQRKAVAASLAAALPALEAQTLEAIDAHARQLELLHAPELDEDALRAASARAGAAQGELAVSTALLLRDVHGVLTPEQLERAAHLHARPNGLGALAEHVRGLVRGARTWTDRQ